MTLVRGLGSILSQGYTGLCDKPRNLNFVEVHKKKIKILLHQGTAPIISLCIFTFPGDHAYYANICETGDLPSADELMSKYWFVLAHIGFL